MIIEYDENEKEIKRFESFSAQDIEQFYAQYGKDATNEFLDHLNMYGKAHLRAKPLDENDNGRLFVEVTE